MSSSSTMASLGDLTLTCKRCSVPFKYSVKDQAFYMSKGFAAPKFCTECRKLRKEESSERAAAVTREREKERLVRDRYYRLQEREKRSRGMKRKVR